MSKQVFKKDEDAWTRSSLCSTSLNSALNGRGSCTWTTWILRRFLTASTKKAYGAYSGHIEFCNRSSSSSRASTTTSVQSGKRIAVVSPTVCSPTSRVDSPTSNMSVRLRLKLDLYYDNHWFTFLIYVRCRSQSIWFVQQLSELLLLPKSRNTLKQKALPSQFTLTQG